MREEITYVANEGVKFTSKEECLAHDKKLEERDVVNKEKKAMLDAIKDKYSSLNDDIKKYETKYKEPVTLYSLPDMSKLMHGFFDLL